MRYFSTFSGIGGFEKGIEQSGIEAECVGFSEIDKYAKAIYQYHFNHRDYGDITTINESELPDFDLFVGGFPCQAFSIAGKRQGFEDTRGTLFFDVARILSAKRPSWFILENVKGLLNHDSGKTIATIYGVLTELGYTVGWEVVNSCHFGVPQNRERIFLIGHLGKGGIGEIFPIRDSQTTNNEKELQQTNIIAGTLSTKNNSGQMSADSGTVLIEKIDKNGNKKRKQNIAACLTGGGNSGGNHSDMDLLKVGTWRTHKDGNGFREVESGLAPTIPARAREDGGGQPVILAHYGHKDKAPTEHKISPTLKAESHGHQPMVKAVLTPDRAEKRQNGRRFKENNEPSFTLTSQDKHGVQIDSQIRRLTPVECERLQGFPDDWTKYGIINGKQVEISDTQRYKTLGNAITVNVIEAIVRKISKQIEGTK